MNYAAKYDRLYQAGYHADWKDRTHAHRHLWPWCLANLEFDTVLDIGASYGALVKTMLDSGKDAMGVDVSAVACEWAVANGRPVRQASATDLPFGPKAFDLVISSDVFEHLEHDDVAPAIAQAIKVCRRFLAIKIGLGEDKAPKWKRIFGGSLHRTRIEHAMWVQLFHTQALYMGRSPVIVEDFGRGAFVLSLED